MLETFDLLRAQRDDDRANLVTPVKFSERMNDDRRSRDLDELFRDLPAESAAAAGGGNDGDIHSGDWRLASAIRHFSYAIWRMKYDLWRTPGASSIDRWSRHGCGAWGPVAVIAPGVPCIAHLRLLVFNPSEDHLARRGLQHAGHDHIDIFTDQSARVVNHYHGAVVQVGHALVVLLAFLEDEDLHDLAWQHDGFQGVRQLVDIEHLDAAQVGDFVEIEVVGHDRRVELFTQLDQLQVYFAHVRKIGFVNLHVERAVFLNALENIKTAPPPVAFGGIRRIGDLLQFAQDELRDENRAAHKTGFGDVGDAPVNDHAGVENFVALLRAAVTQYAAERRKVQVIAFRGADQQSDVGHEKRQRQRHKGFDRLIPVLRGDQEPDHRRTDDAEDRSRGRADQGFKRGAPNAKLEEDYPARQYRAGHRRKRS